MISCHLEWLYNPFAIEGMCTTSTGEFCPMKTVSVELMGENSINYQPGHMPLAKHTANPLIKALSYLEKNPDMQVKEIPHD